MIIYTIDDIEHMPDVNNWFYGIVKSGKYKIGLYEIIPTYGYGQIYLRDLLRPKSIWWIIRDCIGCRRKYLSRITERELVERGDRRKDEMEKAIVYTLEDLEQAWEKENKDAKEVCKNI